jgi:branched-chain amino acid transport system ATP-binding protein
MTTAEATRATATVLELRGLGKRFGGLRAVRDADVTLAQGERVGLLGPNGAGKTTLVNCVCGELKPSEGEVVLGQETVTGLAPHRLFARGLARTYQVVNPFPKLTALESTSLGALAHTRDVREAEEAADEALRELGLRDKRDVPMRQLNIVEMKEVELARIFAGRPTVVFLDELLAGLRPSEMSALLDVVGDVAGRQGWTVVMIEHLVGAVLRFCGRLVVMNEGRVIADGPAEQVARDEAVIDAYLGPKWRQHA